MAIIVHSPYSGQPVKVREQDIGRAVRDEENRIFYVLPKRDGSGYYGAMTRAGGEKDEQRAAEMLDKQAQLRTNVHEQVHDATGRPRSSLRGKLVILFFVLLVLLLAWLFMFGPLHWDKIDRGETPPPNPIQENWRPAAPASPATPPTDEPSSVLPPDSTTPVSIDMPALAQAVIADPLPEIEIHIDHVGPDHAPAARPGDRVVVHYTGYLHDLSHVIDSSHLRRRPLSFVLGEGRVIEGLDLAIRGMRIGESRTITIPPHLAYGSDGFGELIPPDAPLLYEVRLLSIAH